MGLITPAPVSIPWYSDVEVLQGATGFLLGANDHPPAITVVAGIDVVNLGFLENSQVLIRTVTPTTGVIVLFQAFVYATSQAWFSWRGELPVYSGTAIQVQSVGGIWDCHAWGAVIPGPQVNI